MHRLLVNAGTPQVWEIQLKPGVNRIGRSESNDFTINHTSVSGSHCEITVSEAGVFLKDLGSTNGTFLNRAPTQEAWLQPGHHLQFGAVDLLFESDAMPAAAPAATVNTPPIPIPVPVPTASPRPAGLRINLPRHEPAAEAPPAAVEEAVSVEEPEAAIDGGNAVCKSHPKTPARFLCNRCRKYFCDLCVTTRAGGRFCRSCGQSLTPLRTHAVRPTAEKGFFGRLPGAFIYPFKGSGLLILIAATIIFALLAQVSGLFAIVMKLAAIGYLYSFMQNIIHATAAEEAEMPEMPGFDDLFAACFRFAATVVLCFGLPIGLTIAKVFSDFEVSMSVIVITTILGCLYFPMAFLAVAMKDNIMAANPMVVFPAILKAPLEYLVASILLTGVFAARFAGDLVSSGAASVALSTREMSTMFMAFGVRAFWSFCSVYLLTVTMRILGLLYVTKKHKFGWFSH